MQKESFWSAKRVLLERKTSPFGIQKDSFWNGAIEKRRFYTCFSYSATHFRLFCDTFQTIMRYISDYSEIHFRFFSNCSGELAPTSTLVTPFCCKIHPRAISARVLPCASACALRSFKCASNSGVSMLCLRKCSRAMRLSSGIPLR